MPRAPLTFASAGRLKASGFLEISLAIYRLHVVVTWGTTPKQVVQHGRRRGVTISEKWATDFTETTMDKGVTGACERYGDDNTDVLVWLRHRPKKARDYGTLYHELYHAVQRVIRSHNLQDEDEAQAFLYEYLATRCNQAFWR